MFSFGFQPNNSFSLNASADAELAKQYAFKPFNLIDLTIAKEEVTALADKINSSKHWFLSLAVTFFDS